MLSPSDVTAVIVTRGDVNLSSVLDSLIFPNVEVYNNLAERDLMTYGRVVAAKRAPTEIIYSQDDDLIHSRENQERILEAYDEERLVGCMWPEWSAGAKKQGIANGYDDLVFPGSGSISHRDTWLDAIDEYLDRYPCDDFFLLWSDTLIGVIAPTTQLDLRFETLPAAENGGRMANLPDAVALKTEAIRRGREIAAENEREPMRLINKDTGEQVSVSAAGAELLLKRGTHKEPPKPKTTTSKTAPASETEE